MWCKEATALTRSKVPDSSGVGENVAEQVREVAGLRVRLAAFDA
jgi:hypothetical protein